MRYLHLYANYVFIFFFFWKQNDALFYSKSQKGFVEAHSDDGLLEIFGLKEGWHASFVMAELIKAKHIAQVLTFVWHTIFLLSIGKELLYGNLGCPYGILWSVGKKKTMKPQVFHAIHIVYNKLKHHKICLE